MTPQRFWRTTPAQLSLLSMVHAELTNPANSKDRVATTVEEAGIDF
jgi:hypothetical protein